MSHAVVAKFQNFQFNFVFENDQMIWYYVLQNATHPTAAAEVHTVWLVVVVVLVITDPLYIGHQHHGAVQQLLDSTTII